MSNTDTDELAVKLESILSKAHEEDVERKLRIRERRNGKVMKVFYGTGGRGILKIEADDPTGAMSFVVDAEAALLEIEHDKDLTEMWESLPVRVRDLLAKARHQINDAYAAYYSNGGVRVVMDDPDYNYLKDPEFDYLYTTKEEAIKNWPLWEDGTPVRIGEVAMSLRGPRTILGVELGSNSYTLWGRTDEVFDEDVDDDQIVFNPYYIIDEGSFGEDGKQFGHPVRRGEQCDFWTGDEQDLEETERIDMREIAERIKRVSRVYGHGTDEVIKKVLEWVYAV